MEAFHPGSAPRTKPPSQVASTLASQLVLRAGVVIATGFVHVLGDASFILTDPCLGLSGTYPWAFTFATFALLFTFCLEYFLQRYFRAMLGLPQMPGEVLSQGRWEANQSLDSAQPRHNCRLAAAVLALRSCQWC